MGRGRGGRALGSSDEKITMKQAVFDKSIRYVVYYTLAYTFIVKKKPSFKSPRVFLISRDRLGEGLLGHDGVELLGADLAVLVCVRPLDHFQELRVAHGLSKLLGDPLEVAEGDVTGLVVVEEVEDLLDVLAGVLVAHFGGHHIEELFEINFSAPILVDVSNHLVNSLVLGLEPEALHGGFELLWVNGSTSVGIKEVESLPDLLNLLLGETGTLVGLRGLTGRGTTGLKRRERKIEKKRE